MPTTADAQWRAIQGLQDEVSERREFGQETRGMVLSHEAVCALRYQSIAAEMKQIRWLQWATLIGLALVAVGEVLGVPAMLKAFFHVAGLEL